MPYTIDGTGWKGTGTSQEAAREIEAGTIRRRVRAFLERAPRPLTADEIADALLIPGCSVRPRLTELRIDGRVRDSGIRRLGHYGRPMIAWEACRATVAPPPAQSDLFSEARA